MNKLVVSESNTTHLHKRVDEEDGLLEALREIWIPHQRRDLEVRFQMGVLLNDRLGSPAKRQSYGQATIQRVSEELALDKSDISRMRRFAHRFKSFEAFRRSEPEATSWHKVRQLVTSDKATNHVPDSRALWGMTRSVKASIKALSRDHAFTGRQADEFCSALQELVRLAHQKVGFEMPDQSQRLGA